MLPGRGVLYLIELPLLIISLVYFIRRPSKPYLFLLLLLLVSPIPAALAKGPGAAANRAVIMLPWLIILLSAAIVRFPRRLQILLVGVYIVSLFFFGEDYLFHSPYVSAPSMSYGWRELIPRLQPFAGRFPDVRFSRSLSEPHIFVAFYTRYNPRQYQQASASWPRNVKFLDQFDGYYLGKYRFGNIYPIDSVTTPTLFIGKPENFPPGFPEYFHIDYPLFPPGYYCCPKATMKKFSYFSSFPLSRSCSARGCSPCMISTSFANLSLINASRTKHFPAVGPRTRGWDMANPCSTFYGQFPYWIGQVFHLFGFQIIDSVKINFILTLVVAAIGMYLLGRKYWGNRRRSLRPVLYIRPLSVSGHLGSGSPERELCPGLVPFIFLSLDNFLDDHRPRHLLGLILFASALLITHNLSALMLTPFLAGWTIYRLWQKKTVRPLISLSCAAVAVFLLSAFYLLPVIFESHLVTLTRTTADYYYYQLHWATLKQLFVSRFWGMGALSGVPTIPCLSPSATSSGLSLYSCFFAKNPSSLPPLASLPFS